MSAIAAINASEPQSPIDLDVVTTMLSRTDGDRLTSSTNDVRGRHF
jgi:hypothetical protein